MIAMQLIALCLMAGSALASPTPLGPHDAMTCPFVVYDDCSMKPLIESECQKVYFGKCTKAPSAFVSWYSITNYNPATDMVTFHRFTDPECTKRDDSIASIGKPNSCMGPIADVHGIKAYMNLTVVKTYPTASTKSVEPTNIKST
eukprot:Ihof_evm2s173 gene=Ihof_evmTU2s173